MSQGTTPGWLREAAGLWQRAARLGHVVRASNWFYPKVSPLLAIAYAQILISGAPGQPALERSLLLAFVICGLGAWGHVINDVSDLASDRRAGKVNVVAGLGSRRQAAISLAAGAAALAPLGFVKSLPAIAVALADFLIATLYSVRPVRLKERGMLGVAADALAVHALPTLFVLFLFADVGRVAPLPFALSAVIWSVLFGLRGIISHQVWDHENDVRSGTRTLVTRVGPGPARHILRAFLFPAEMLAFATLLGLVAPASPVVVPMVLLYAVVDLLRVHLWRCRLEVAPATSGVYMLPADFYQAWFPLALAVQLAARNRVLTVLPFLHMALFFGPLQRHAREVVALVGDAVRAARARRSRASTLTLPRLPFARRPALRVFVSSHFWTLNGVNVFSANLVRGLTRRGVDASLLLTEQDTNLVTIRDPRLPLPEDVPVDYLPVSRRAGWGAHWGAMIAYLEGHAPCIYIPNSDWRHSCVSPLLSDRVRTVGIVHSDDPLHYDHVGRLGKYWNAVVTVSRTVAAKTIALDPSLEERVQVIPIGVNVAEKWPERRPGARALEIVYHGLLIQRQKRILDLPRIMEALVRRGVNARLTMVGGGAQEHEVKEASHALVEQGAVRFLPVQPNEKVLALLEESDAFVMASEFEGMPNALLEAMGRGCVPVVTNVHSGIPEVVKDGASGFLVPVGDIEAFADRFALLATTPDRRREMSRAAYDAVNGGTYRTVDMVAEYEALFDRLLSAKNSRSGYRRPPGVLSHPPAQVAGINLFPVECGHVVEGVGAFPSPADAADFQEQLERVRRPGLRRQIRAAFERRQNAKISRLRDFNVVVAVPYWGLSGVNVFSAHLVRGLLTQGIAAEILLTEHDTFLVNMPDAPMPLPSDIPVRGLPVGQRDIWGRHWGTMIRYLEERRPCIYLPNYDWRHSCVTPRLSDRVAVVGILHGDDPLHYDHLRRLGRYWNRIVAVSRRIAGRVMELHPESASRLVTIPYGVSVPVEAPVRGRRPGEPLRIIYHGVLNQRQKRILDLPRIMASLETGGVPVELTIAGGGPEEEQLRADCRELQEQGRVRFLGVLANERILELLGQNDAFIMTSGFEGLPNALLEAMGRGCIPVVTAIESGIPELVRHGTNGFLVPVGDIAGFTACLARLQRDPDLRRLLSESAYRTVSEGAYRVEDMVNDYLELFQRVLFEARTGRFRRPRGALNHPPASVSGVNLFPVDCPVVAREGPFPSLEHVREFRREIGLLREGRLPRTLRAGYRGFLRVAGGLRRG